MANGWTYRDEIQLLRCPSLLHDVAIRWLSLAFSQGVHSWKENAIHHVPNEKPSRSIGPWP